VEAGALLGFSSAKLSLMENALQPIEQAEIIALGLAYRVKSAAWKQVAGRAAGDVPLNAAEDFEEIHPEASVLRGYGDDAILRFLHSHTARLESGRDPLKVEVVVSEDAVTRSAEGPLESRAVLVDIVHLAERGRALVQVLTDKDSEQPRIGESFTFLSFHHKQHSDVVFVERPQFSSYLEDPIVCQLMLQAFETLQRSAMDPQESIDFIAESAGGCPR